MCFFYLHLEENHGANLFGRVELGLVTIVDLDRGTVRAGLDNLEGPHCKSKIGQSGDGLARDKAKTASYGKCPW